ncbi:MAG: DNA gyrase/topoisomerase IV subunit A [Bacteroidetes bacterium]|nr:MAG: DNA gyrase/topoisomerase IV subunit A [Bacteroidota bacterium]
MNNTKNDITSNHSQAHDAIPVSGMYKDWFLDYASYVILERAVPAIEDGLKPVQRRILHAMNEIEDGRYNKVANVIGQTMQYHPHGDASIADAMVNLGQKELLIDTQGNWGDYRTGDSAAAPRYIEARLSKFAIDVVFNPQTTSWQLSYDGRKREPVAFPVKFPLLLAQGVEGIAVGLSTKIMPHNFCELLNACIDILKGKEIEIYPDFLTGGLADVSNYAQGGKGSKVRIRAKIEDIDGKSLVIREIPFGTTTTSLMESIVKANENGKIKIKKVIDNTAKEVEIVVVLAPNTSSDITISALYAFTDCEISVSPSCCVIVEDKPMFLGVHEILKISTNHTVKLLEQELQIRKAELMEKILFASLEQLFIEKRIYRDIENATTWEAVLNTIDAGLTPYKPDFYREITQDDILKLTEIKIKRISKFDGFKAEEFVRNLKTELSEVEENLANLVNYAIKYFRRLLATYGKGRERKTEIRTFDTITATKVVANNQKLYINREEGFIGYGLKKDEFVSECSDIDEVIVFFPNGIFKVVKIAEKVFVGKNILHAEIFDKNDQRKVYNLAYLDTETGFTMVKRFQIGGITREKEYDLTSGGKGSKILYFTSNPKGESQTIGVLLTAACTAKNKNFDYDFAELAIKGRGVKGNILTRYPVKNIKFKKQGNSTLGGQSIFYDPATNVLNTDKKGLDLGTFQENDKILVIYKDGNYELSDFALTNRYDQVVFIKKFHEDQIISVIYYEAESKSYYAKRFKIETTTPKKKFLFVGETEKATILLANTENDLQVEIKYQRTDKQMAEKIYDMDLLSEVKNWKMKANRMSIENIKSLKWSEQK